MIESGWFAAGLVVVLVLCLVAYAAIYSNISDDCDRRGGVVIVDKFNQPICVGAPPK